MIKKREDLEFRLLGIISEVKLDKTKVKKIKKGMKEYSFTPGEIQSYFSDTENKLPEVDIRALALLTEELYINTLDDLIKPSLFFTDAEMKKARTFDNSLIKEFEEIEFPIELNKVNMIDSENYYTVWDIKFIKRLMDNQLLRYNFDTQREHTKIKRKDSFQKGINLNNKAVKEIEEKALNGELEVTTITINALVGTADDGEELEYHANKMNLYVKEGTFLDIVDGFHRITGTLNALEKNPDLNQVFLVSIKNFNIKRAQRHLAQISKINPINKTHITALEESRKADKVVRQLKEESDLKGKVSQTHQLHSDELVTYNTLADTIEEEFNLKTNIDATKTGDYLVKFFDYLIGSYPNEFIDNFKKVRYESLINENTMFAGYIVLANRMKKSDIDFKYITDIVDNIDFSKSNPEWVEKGVIDKEGYILGNAKNSIKNFFRSVDVEELTVKG